MNDAANERQRRYRKRAKESGLVRIELRIPYDEALMLDSLAELWGCSKKEVFRRVLKQGWEKAGRPVAGVSAEAPKSQQRSTSAIIEAHRQEIERRARDGHKPTQIATWLSGKTGVKITGSDLNSWFKHYEWWSAGKTAQHVRR